jgi:hypothetical protein
VLRSNNDGADHDVDFRSSADPTCRRARASGDGCEAGQGKRKDRELSEAGDRRKNPPAPIVPNSSSSAWMAPRALVSHRRLRPNIRSWRRGRRSKKNESTSDTSAACLSCIFTRSAPLACWLTSAGQATTAQRHHQRFCGPARLRLPCPPFAIAHQPSRTYCFFHSSALIGSSEMPYTALTFTVSVNIPQVAADRHQSRMLVVQPHAHLPWARGRLSCRARGRLSCREARITPASRIASSTPQHSSACRKCRTRP